MNKNLQFFLAFMAIVLPLNLLISYVSDGGKLTTKAFAGDLVVTLLIFFVIAGMGRFNKQTNKK